MTKLERQYSNFLESNNGLKKIHYVHIEIDKDYNVDIITIIYDRQIYCKLTFVDNKLHETEGKISKYLMSHTEIAFKEIILNNK